MLRRVYDVREVIDLESRSEMATVVRRTKKAKKVGKNDLVELLEMFDSEGAERAMYLDVVGTAEAAKILGVERARIGKWRRKQILLGNGERIEFPDPILMATTSATLNKCDSCRTVYSEDPKKDGCPECGSHSATKIPDYTKLAATPLWWADDVRSLAKILKANKPRD